MRPILLIFSLFCASYLTINAQTNTWTGAGANTNWNTVANWSLNAVPTATNDVIIPTGHTVAMNVAGTMKSISVQGNSTLNILNALTFTNASSFAKGTTIVWSGGGFYGGGVLTNNGTVNMTTSATKYIADGTIVNNNSLINMNGSFTLYINSGSINNQNSGIIDIQARPNLAPNTGQSHQITNSGIIKKTGDTGAATISVAMINTGAINVDSGILNLTSEAKTFDGGEYNVTTDATLNLSTAISLSGTMTGLVNGDLNWNSVLTVADEATFNFTGTSGINWVDGFLDGGGVLNNISRMNLITRNTKYIRGFTILNNTGLLNLSDSFTLYINAGTLRNLSTGIIDIQALPHLAPNTVEAHSIVNAGLIKKTTNTGVATISMALINTGTISVEMGTLKFSGEAKTFDGGIYNVTAGNTLDMSTEINLSKTMTGLVNGNLNWNSKILVAKTAVFQFTGSAGINWVDGFLEGGGILTNMTKLNMITSNTKYITTNTTLSNAGVINCTDGFTLYINEGLLNNQTKGIINIQGVPNLAPNTGLGHKIVNSGTIKKTTDTGTATISVALVNTGTITVEKGTLNLTNEGKSFDGGVYNVTADAVMNLSTKITCSGTLMGTLAGSMSWNSELNVGKGVTANLNFTGTTGFNWNNGSLTGGGTLNNLSKLNMISNATKAISDATSLKNSGTITCLDSFTLYINEGTLNNDVSGIIDIQGTPNLAPNTALTHSIINSGLIKKTVNSANATISVALTNTGTIAVESGMLNLTNEAKTFIGGIYNVSDKSGLNLSTRVNCSETLTGIATGPISWNHVINVAQDNPATFKFTSTSGINWTDGSLTGGGVLTNAGTMNLTTNATKYISDGSTLINTDLIKCLDAFTLYINEGVIDNQSLGVIDIQALSTFAPNTSAPHSILNSGLIKKTSNSGVSQINVKFTNSGTIDSQAGTLRINANPFVNAVEGIIKGIATVDLPVVANYTNDGTFAPGGSPGTLTVLGNYKSSATSVLDVELNGLIQGKEHDLLAITGTNVVFNGRVNVSLNFAPTVNAEFIVATTSGVIDTCNLAKTTSTEFDGKLYNFTVSCRDNKEVVLKLQSVVLAIDDYELVESSVKLHPNPVKNLLTIKNTNNLELESGQIIDFTGKVIVTYDLKNMGITKVVSLENYASGLYFIKIKGINGVITKRIIKE